MGKTELKNKGKGWMYDAALKEYACSPLIAIWQTRVKSFHRFLHKPSTAWLWYIIACALFIRGVRMHSIKKQERKNKEW